MRGIYTRLKDSKLNKQRVKMKDFIRNASRLARYKLYFKHIGVGVTIKGDCLFYEPRKIEIGDHTFINYRTVIGEGNVKIGSYVIMGPDVMLIPSNHKFDRNDIPIALQGMEEGEIVIEDDVWIGGKVSILSNVNIGTGRLSLQTP